MKNKHNTMNSAASQKTYMKMQDKILRNDEAICYLVEVIAKNSQDIIWKVSLDSEQLSNKRIRRISIDQFYQLVTGIENAFKELCQTLPIVIDDVVESIDMGEIKGTVFTELQEISPDLLKSIYLLSFKKYQGFSELDL